MRHIGIILENLNKIGINAHFINVSYKENIGPHLYRVENRLSLERKSTCHETDVMTAVWV